MTGDTMIKATGIARPALNGVRAPKREHRNAPFLLIQTVRVHSQGPHLNGRAQLTRELRCVVRGGHGGRAFNGLALRKRTTLSI